MNGYSMKYSTTLALALMFVCTAVSLNAQVSLNKLGQSTMNFQLVGVSPRASAMGDAVYATSDGAEAVFYNPACLSAMERTYEARLYYTQWIADINYIAGSFGWNLGDYGSLGIGLLAVDYGTIHGTRLMSSSATTQSIAYEEVGDVPNVGAYSFGLSYAKSINTQFSIGGTLRYTGQNLGESILSGGLTKHTAAKLVFDVGVRYKTGFKSFQFGMALRNFSSQLRREQIDEQLPQTFSLGTSIDLYDFIDPSHGRETSLLLAVDYLHSNSYSERINIGTEYLFAGMFAVRGGYQTNRDIASWSAGVGFFTTLEEYDVRVDYAFSQMTYFDGVNRLSLGVAF